MRESTQELFRLDGKTALVTGGNGGIGKGIARGLAGAGAAIVIAARNRAKTDDAVAEIKKDFGVEAMGLTVDMRKPPEVEAMVKQTVERFGRIDIVVANAGIGFHKPPTEITLEEWDENIEINLRHTFVVAKAAYPHMKKAGGGKIITLGSMTSIFGIGFLPSYGASKGGILSLSRSLAVAWARDNIQVNCILPGFIDSGLSADGEAGDSRLRGGGQGEDSGRQMGRPGRSGRNSRLPGQSCVELRDGRCNTGRRGVRGARVGGMGPKALPFLAQDVELSSGMRLLGGEVPGPQQVFRADHLSEEHGQVGQRPLLGLRSAAFGQVLRHDDVIVPHKGVSCRRFHADVRGEAGNDQGLDVIPF